MYQESQSKSQYNYSYEFQPPVLAQLYIYQRPSPNPSIGLSCTSIPSYSSLKKVSVSIISCISLGPYLILYLSPSPDLIISSSHYPRLISNFCVNSYLSVKSESHSFSKPSPSSLNPSNISSRPVTTPSQFGRTSDISTRSDQKI